MVGIYKITNKQNGHAYIGQSRDIHKRWNNHITAARNPNDAGYDYPLYRAFRKYGLENFTFDILEECDTEVLNQREHYWIQFYSPEYNQTVGIDYTVRPQKLTVEQVREIQQILLADMRGEVSHVELAHKYNVHKDTIRDINVGRTWRTEGFTYPLHYFKFDNSRPEALRQFNKITYCMDCGKEISNGSLRCTSCDINFRRQLAQSNKPVTREELKTLIRTKPFTQIGAQFNVTDNAIRKWCATFNLPTTKKEINAYSDEEWALI